jgi:hypothetical protein
MDAATDDQVKAVLQLLEKAEAILREQKDENQATARRFNIFSALRVERSELPHSRFLAYLLDPQGLHDQNNLFLRAFLKDVLQEQIERLVLLKLTESKVATELSTEYGNLDIVITLSDKQIIVIENKVDAGEGEDQLKRYQSWLNKQPGGPHRLVFLTPDGRDPFSCDPADMKKVKRVSYEMIANWLDNLRVMVPASLEVVLGQYANLWRSIPMNEKLLELLRDPRNFGTAVDISKAVEEIQEEERRQFLNRIYEDLKNRLSHGKFGEYWDVPMPTTGKYSRVGLLWRGRRNDWKGYFAVFCEAQESNWKDLFIGICRGAAVPPDKQDMLDKEISQRLGIEHGQKSPRSFPWWTGGLYMRELVGRKAMDAKELISGGEQLSKLVADKLWGLFETYREDLEKLNCNYPYAP